MNIKTFPVVFFTALCLAANAEAGEPLLNEKPLPLLAAPTFKEPLGEPFIASKGKWNPSDGMLSVVNIPSENHIPVLHHKIGLASAVIELEFRRDGAGSFLVGCDSDRHVGRVVINASSLSIGEDSGKPSRTIAKLEMPVKAGEWHHLRVEWKGDEMVASLDGKELRAKHSYLASRKTRSWLASTDTFKIRNLKICGEKYPATP